MILVSALVFVLESLVPGDVTWTILGDPLQSGLPHKAYTDLAHELGIDRPLWEQYWDWLAHAVRGDLGVSVISKQAITQAITQRFPVTLSLAVGALLLSLVLGVSLGVVSAIRGGALGRAVDVVAMVGWVLPGFWLAAELVVIFSVKLSWLPAIGYVPFAQSPGDWLRSLVLPVVALAIAPVGAFAKFTREAMLDALSSEYIRMARANGIASWSIVLRHAFKTAALQVLTLSGLLTVGLLGGSVFIETVFALPGMGLLLVGATQGLDVQTVQGVAVFFTLIVVAVNLIVDLAYSLVSPKVHVT